MSRRNQEFQTIRSEGGLLPPDLLRRVIDPRGSLKGTKPEDYGLPEGERLNEVITQSWNRLRRHWSEFRAAAARLPEGEAGTGLTNDKWSLPLLRELGFGLLPTGASPEIAGRTYAISRFFGPVPVHLVGCGLSLDRRAAGVRGAAGGNPHGLVQEVLNRSPDHLWGIVCNGLRLRFLRDNQALSRQSFLEFDLEAMFGAEAYSDFVLLWLVGHATRFAPRDGSRIETCWLEEWTKEAQEQGTRALKDLRGSVERALQVLGEGFTSHPKNAALREALRSGSLPLADFHGQLLRLVYRLIFLFVAEDRTLEGQPLLHPRDESETARVARERYANHYGTARLRELAGRIKGSRHGDLWRQFQILVGALSGDAAFEATRRSLALPALGSFLWSPGSTTALNDTELTNHDFLEALRHLAYTRQGKVLRPVDYRNLGAEELGGVYESLLALTPQISADGARFTFAEFAGNERKTSGSYYTPDMLVQCLLDSALDPVVEQAIRGKTGADAETALLGLKVCDPAVGSGHFLVGAAHRLARHLSRVRAQAQGESEPSPLLYQHALRDVIGRCLYGVDVNPMAAELCRVSLWLEALEPGKPLSFLDHHIRVGNSLLGATPELIAGGLPDSAFDAIEGDDKKICSALKKRNRLEREGQRDMLHLMAAEPLAEYSSLAGQSRGIDEVSDATLDEIKRKAEQFERLVVSEEYRHAQCIADAWCAAFVWSKRSGMPAEPPTSDALNRLRENGNALTEHQAREVRRLASQYQFLHWWLAFPEVFAKGGFDLVLGNPPWERLQLEETQYFAAIAPSIASARARDRKRLIEELATAEPETHARYLQALRHNAGETHFVSHSGRFPASGVGNVSAQALFVELASSIGRSAGLIVPRGLATQDNQSALYRALLESGRLRAILDFENKRGLFPETHRQFWFCLIVLGSPSPIPQVRFAFFLEVADELADAKRTFLLDLSTLRRLSPNSLSPPTARRSFEIALLERIYLNAEVLKANEGASTWGWASWQMFNETHEAKELIECGNLPVEDVERLYEAKLIHQFDHRYASYINHQPSACSDAEKADPSFKVQTRYGVRRSIWSERVTPRNEGRSWILGLRLITNASNERTLIATVLPRCAGTVSIPFVACAQTPERQALLLGNLNAFALDFVCRLRVSGMSLNHFVLHQLAVLPASTYDREVGWLLQSSAAAWVLPRVLELTYTAWDVEAFAGDCGWDGPPFRWDEERRFLIRCELDAAFFHLYLPADADGQWRLARKADGCPHDETPEELAALKRHFPTPRDAVAYIMDSFPIVRRKDEERYGGDYRTKRVVLEIYDAMQEAVRTGQPYQTRLDLPPGPPRDAEGNFVRYAQVEGNPPPHIHLPRDGTTGGDVALQLSDLATRFPATPFPLRLGTSGTARTMRVRPVRTADIQVTDRTVLSSPKLQCSGSAVPAAVGRLRVESRTDASDGSSYVLVTVRGDDGNAQARFSEEEWHNLTTVGIVEESGEA